jgi:hypothetical protein
LGALAPGLQGLCGIIAYRSAKRSSSKFSASAMLDAAGYGDASPDETGVCPRVDADRSG